MQSVATCCNLPQACLSKYLSWRNVKVVEMQYVISGGGTLPPKSVDTPHKIMDFLILAYFMTI